jgi:hypothetical protein
VEQPGAKELQGEYEGGPGEGQAQLADALLRWQPGLCLTGLGKFTNYQVNLAAQYTVRA